MKKIFVLTLFLTTVANADEWVVLNPADLLQYEVIQPNVYSYAAEGLYIKHKTTFLMPNVSCSKKNFVAFTNEKLADRALSSLLFAIASNKTMKFFIQGCTNDYPKAVNFLLVP